MSEYVLSCCSTADMSVEYYEKRNIPRLCFHFNMDGVDYPDDGKTMPFEEFYKRIADGATPTTAQVNVEEFIEFFDSILKEGRDILHLSFTSGMSGTYQSACIAQSEMQEKYPERKIMVVDTLAASGGYGLLVDMACDMRDNGDDIETVYNWVMENRLKVHHWLFSTDLSCYFRGGRISRTSAVFGTMFNICPVLNVNREGKLLPLLKCRGKKRAIEELLSKMRKHIDGGENYSGKCFIVHSDFYEDACNLAELIKAEFKNIEDPLRINSIGTVIGSHSGPGTIALFFMGDERII